MALSPEPHSAQHSDCSCPLVGGKEDSPREQTQDGFIITLIQRQGETPSLQKTGMISEEGETNPRSHSCKSHPKICLTSQPTPHITDEHSREVGQGGTTRVRRGIPQERSSLSRRPLRNQLHQHGYHGLRAHTGRLLWFEYKMTSVGSCV